MKGSDLLIRCLEEEGVERIFGIPGEENLDVMDSLVDSDIEFITTRHEEGAAFMAGVTARLTGEPGVCLSTLGPGATNLTTGVADAYLSHYPVIVLTGQKRLEWGYEPQKQFIDLVSMFRPIAKDSFSVRAAGRIPSLTRKAFCTATAEKPGPVHIELPEDVMSAEVVGSPIRPPSDIPIIVRPDSLSPIREMIGDSDYPLLLIGPGVIRGDAVDEVRTFAERWQIPAVHTWMGNGVIPYDNPLSLHTVGLRKHDFMRRAFEKSDLILLAGYDLLEFQPVFWDIGREKNIVDLGPTATESASHFEPDVKAMGGLKHLLHALTDGAERKKNWASSLKEQLCQRMDETVEEEGLVKPQSAVKCIRKVLGREDIVVSDVGAHLLWMMKLYPTYKENTLIASNGLIPMGFGVPAAIASKVVYPSRNVVAVCGDGGFMMTSMELETAARLNVPFVTVIFNDQGLGLIRTRQEKTFGRTVGVETSNPDFVKYAESFGAHGYRVDSLSGLEGALKTALKRDELAVIEVLIDYDENSRLTV